MTVLLGDGTGAFTPQATHPQTGDVPSSVAVGDFNRDGNPDLATADEGDDQVTVLLGDGTGAFPQDTHPQTGNAPSRWRSRTSTATGFPTSPPPTSATTR